MDKCRICLGNKKSLICIFDSNRCISYADMLVSIANVKVFKSDVITNKICRSCRKTLQEAYDFKLQIERSDAALNAGSNLKKINFNNINDIKIEIKIETDYTKSSKQYEDCITFEHGVNEICYSDTIIKKVKSAKTDDVCLKPVPVLEFLKTIKDEPVDDNFDNDNFDTDYSDMNFNDEDYVPSNKLLCAGKAKKQYKKTKPIGIKKNVNHTCIKPVYLKDVKMIYPKRISNPKQKKSKTKDTHICPHCGVLTKTLKSHILKHTGERKCKCDECSKAFYTESALKAHKKRRHVKIKDFKCDKCTAAFSDKTSLNSHQIMHNPEMNHICDICSKAFKRIQSLRRHRSRHNSANKTVMCDLCNMSFFSKYGLRHHLRIHTGERPYNCEICAQPYSYKHDFNRHCLKKHGVFFKRRSVFVMNEEVLKKEKILMRDLMLRVQGVIKDDQPLNPFEGPQAVLAFEQTIKALESKQIPIDFQF